MHERAKTSDIRMTKTEVSLLNIIASAVLLVGSFADHIKIYFNGNIWKQFTHAKLYEAIHSKSLTV